jgi:hypothetical protein
MYYGMAPVARPGVRIKVFELRDFENRMSRIKHGLKKDKITGDWIKLLKS